MLPDDPDTRARLFYLVTLLIAVLAFVLYGQGQRLGRSLRDLAVWGLIILTVVIAYGFRDRPFVAEQAIWIDLDGNIAIGSGFELGLEARHGLIDQAAIGR